MEGDFLIEFNKKTNFSWYNLNMFNSLLLKNEDGKMKFKFPFLIFETLVIFLVSLYFFYVDYTITRSIKYILFHLFDAKGYFKEFLFFLFSIFMLICSLNIELIYDKKNGILWRKIFFIKMQIKCSEIAVLCYIPLPGHLLILGRTGETLFFWSHIYHKSNFRKLFNEIKKDYPNIEIDI